MNIFESLAKYSRSPVHNARVKAADGQSTELIDNITRLRGREHSGPRYDISPSYRRVHSSPFPERTRLPFRSYDREPATYYDEEVLYDDADVFTPDFFKVSPTDPGGFRDLLLQECLQHLHRRNREFSEFQSQAVQLEKEVPTHLSSS